MTRRLFVRRDSIVDYSWVRLVDVLREVVGFAQLWFFIAALVAPCVARLDSRDVTTPSVLKYKSFKGSKFVLKYKAS
jgi:hypothetical protein